MKLAVRTTILIAACALAFPGMALASGAPDQTQLIASPNPKLAANKRLVYDMWREIVQAGRADRVPAYFTETYIQHNPNIASGREPLVRYLAGSRPVRPIEPRITFPIIAMIAEGDFVTVVNERRYPDPDHPGQSYVTTWFDLYRIEDGKIAEHWDPALLDRKAVPTDPNSAATRP